MGARMLRRYLEQPLIEKEEIMQRLDAVEELKDNAITREELREYLNPVYDLERLISRISYQTANPRDLVAFKTSLSMLPHIKYIMKSLQSPLLVQLQEEIDELEDLFALVIQRLWTNRRLASVTVALSKKDTMRRSTGSDMRRPRASPGWQSWRPRNGKRPASKR